MYIGQQVESGCDSTLKVDNGFISYIVEYIKLHETGNISQSDMVSNLTSAITLQCLVMELFGVLFRKESAGCLSSPEFCSAMYKLTQKLCIVHYSGKEIAEYNCNALLRIPFDRCSINYMTVFIVVVFFSESSTMTSFDIHLVVFKCLVWWTGLNDSAGANLARTAIVTNLCNLLPIFTSLNINVKVSLSK